MSWNGIIPRNPYRVKGLCNKRNKKSPKAIAAKLAKRMQARDRKFRGHRDSDDKFGENSWA